MILKTLPYPKAFTFLLFYLVVIIHSSLLADVFRVGPARLDLGILLLVYVALGMGTKEAIIFGFGLGLVLDVLSPAWLGAGALTKCTLGYIIGYLKEQLYVENTLAKTLIVLLAVVANDFFYYLFVYGLDIGQTSSVLLETSFVSALYTTLVAGIILFVNRKRLKPRVQ